MSKHVGIDVGVVEAGLRRMECRVSEFHSACFDQRRSNAGDLLGQDIPAHRTRSATYPPAFAPMGDTDSRIEQSRSGQVVVVDGQRRSTDRRDLANV